MADPVALITGALAEDQRDLAAIWLLRQLTVPAFPDRRPRSAALCTRARCHSRMRHASSDASV